MAKSGFICKDGASCYYMRNEGMGGFLNPPGDAEHKWSIEEERGGHVVGGYSLRGAINDKYAPSRVKISAHWKLIRSEKNIVPDPIWIAEVYNYFRHCYAPEGFDRNVDNCIVDRTNSLPAERHLAVLHIKEWFPDYPIRYEFLDGAPFGAWSKNG